MTVGSWKFEDGMLNRVQHDGEGFALRRAQGFAGVRDSLFSIPLITTPPYRAPLLQKDGSLMKLKLKLKSKLRDSSFVGMTVFR